MQAFILGKMLDICQPINLKKLNTSLTLQCKGLVIYQYHTQETAKNYFVMTIVMLIRVHPLNNCYWLLPDYTTNCRTDIVFVVDESGSIGSSNFARVKSFLSQLVRRLDINSRRTRVGLVTYSTHVRRRFYLNTYSTVSSIRSAILSLPYSGGSTDTAAALTYVRRSMLLSSRGDRSSADNVVVVLTDGKSNSRSATLVSIMPNFLLETHFSNGFKLGPH